VNVCSISTTSARLLSQAAFFRLAFKAQLSLRCWRSGGAAGYVFSVFFAFGGTAPMRRDTIFRLASVTKPITAVAGSCRGRRSSS
jgi:CubicO group peptidase (beta-lactamase class C family)